MNAPSPDTHDPAEYTLTKRRVITRRGVLWLGQTCNLRCHFCYFLDRIDDKSHPEHPFMSVAKAKQICSTLADYYGNNAIDIQGGEPTIYPHIFDLTHHCREIGLLPTLITNAIPLSNARNCHQLKQAGIRDLLISIQGLDDTYDQIVGTSNAFPKQMRGLENVASSGIPVRFNCVLSKPALPQLVRIAQLAVDYGARVVNFLAFNPFEDQQLQGKRSAFNVPRYTEVSQYLNPAMDLLASSGIECNVRYFPICMVDASHRKSIFNFQQLPYDIHEWDYASWSWTGMKPQRMRDGDLSPVVDLPDVTIDPAIYSGSLKYAADSVRTLIHRHPVLRGPATALHRSLSRVVNFSKSNGSAQGDRNALYRANGRMRASTHCRYHYADACSRCSAKQICDGFHGDYAAIFGTDEARPIVDHPPTVDPTHYIQDQDKVVEPEDYGWAL